MMVGTTRYTIRQLVVGLLAAVTFAIILIAQPTAALTPIETPKPKPGSFGLEATKTKAPPTRGATITTPGNGASFSTSPITVNGICPTDLLVQVFNNGVMVGSVVCKNGNFSLQVGLFSGENELTAAVYDELDQTGPKSNIVKVRYNDSQLSAFGELVTLTSSYGRRSAPAGSELSWPLQLSGGTGPYAFSIDWGDGSKPQLKSQALSGVVTIAHTYERAGIYQVNISVTDTNGVTAFLQVIAVSSGKVDGAAAVNDDSDKSNGASRTEILWAPAAVSAGLLFPSFWLGRRSQLTSLRNKMLKERDSYEAH